MSNTLRNEAVPSTIGSKGIVYANGNIMYYKNPSGTVSQLNVANLNKTTITKSTDYTLTASDCNGTKTFVFNRFNDLDYNPLVAVLPTTATNLAVKIVNRSNSTLIVRPPVGSTIYMNGKTYTNTSELQLNYFNQNIELLAVDSTTWVGLTNNSTEYEIAKIIVNQLTYKCFILTTKGNLYFNGVNLDVSAGAFANFSNDFETTLATSKNVFLPIPQKVNKFDSSYVIDFQYIYVSNTDETLYVLDSNGDIWTTGITNTSGKMGRTFSVGDGFRPVEANKSFNRIFAYNNLAFATTTDKELWAWGDNTNFRLGINDNLGTSIATPTRVLDSTFCIRDITIGSNYAMALSEDGRMFSWGVGLNGQLGLSVSTGAGTPSYAILMPLEPYSKCTWSTITLTKNGVVRAGGLKLDGTAWTWGQDSAGEIGNNGATQRPYNMVVGGLRFTRLSMGGNVSAGLTAGGQLWTWGTNTSGQLGDNTSGAGTSKSSPVPVCGGHTFCQVATGLNHMGTLKADGSLWVWGNNNQGQLGDNTIVNKSTPVTVFGGHVFCKVDFGDVVSIALKADGSAWTWGRNDNGVLGINSAATSCITPVAVCGGHTFCQITVKTGSGGFSPSLYGLKADGSVWAWGENSAGALGDNTIVAKSTPVAVCGGHTFCQISGGSNHILALKADGSVWAWGGNTGGCLGDNTTTNRSTPVAVCGGQTFCQISAGIDQSLAIRADGKQFFWGSTGSSNMSMNNTGNGAAENVITPTQIETFSISQISICQIFANPVTNTSFALASNGRLFGWGTNTAGIIGDGTIANKRTPVSICGGHTFCSIVQTETGTAGAIRNDGTLWLWGNNASGQLGNNDTVSQLTPVLLYNFFLCSPTFSKIYKSIGLKSDGSVWSWGTNNTGQLGDNTLINRSTPVAVCGGHTFCQIGYGSLHTVALKADGSAWSWGSNGSGQLGINTLATTSALTPVAVCGGHTFCQVATGVGDYTVALKADGSAWAWGQNTFGGLGDNTAIDKSIPVAVCGGHTFCQVATGNRFTVALKADGSAWTWGDNSNGQLGRNNITTINTPVQVCGGHTFCQITAGQTYTLALKADGSAWTWGLNTSGQLGDNSITSRLTPVAVCGGHTFCQIKSYGTTTIALKADGSAWGWGFNGSGELGDNTIVNKSTPVAVCGGHTFCQISSGQASLALKVDGSAWTWGGNANGQLGDNTTTGKSTPVAVCSYFSPTILTSICEVKSTSTNFYARQANGTLWSWGNYNSTTIFGKLGNGTFSNTTLVPVSVCSIPNETVCKIFAYPNIGLTASINSPIVYTRNNKLFTWGSNFKNVGGVKGLYLPSLCARSVSLGYSVRDIVYTRTGFTIIHRSDGTAWSWGNRTYSSDPLGTGGVLASNTIASVCGGHSFLKMYAGYNNSAGHSFFGGLKADGSLWMWGQSLIPDGTNNSGQIGGNYNTPYRVVCGGHTFCQVSFGNEHILFIKSDGSTWSWGRNNNLGANSTGALGDGTTTTRNTPVSVCGNHTFCQIVAGFGSSFGLKANGQLWSWGRNSRGQLGDNTAVAKCQPVQVCGGHTFCQVFTSVETVHAIRNDGTLWAWGQNTFGILGDNTTVDKSTPVAVCGGYTFCSAIIDYTADVNYYHIFKTSDSNYYRWGLEKNDINFGRGIKLYTSGLPNSNISPVKIYPKGFLSSACKFIIPDKFIITQSVGLPQGLILTNDGSVWMWGFSESITYGGSGGSYSSIFFNEPKYLLTPQEITKFYEVY